MKQFKYTINDIDYQVKVHKVEDTFAEVEVNGTSYKVIMDKPAKKQATTMKRPVQQQMSASGVIPIAHPVKSVSRGVIQSPLPGIILSIDCKIGDTVKKGQKLLVLEAMKMENTIPSDRDGIVSEIKVNEGDSVPEGAELVIIL